MPNPVSQHLANLSSAAVHIPVEQKAWAALQVQAKFYNETAAILTDTSMSDISQLACICTKCVEATTALNKIRGQD